MCVCVCVCYFVCVDYKQSYRRLQVCRKNMTIKICKKPKYNWKYIMYLLEYARCSKSGVGKLQPAGHMRPTVLFCAGDSKKINTCILTYMVSKLVTEVEGDPKAPFSIATTLRRREGVTSFPRLLHLTLDTYLKLLSVKQGSI